MLILDFYVDEPACFGVPPYLSPYCRYAAGALVAGGIPEERISYMTVDQWRERGKSLADDFELVLLIAGATVPGKYLGGKIGTLTEVLEFLDTRAKDDPDGITLIGGPIRYASSDLREQMADKGGILIRGDLELYAERLARHPGGVRAGAAEIFAEKENGRVYTGERHTYADVDRWAVRGAFLTKLHPNFPRLILELETYRGCTRDVFCSFCTEAFYGKPVFRNTPGILEEVEELYRMNNRYFRLGRQADLMTYLPHMNDFKNSFPRPEPSSLLALYGGIRKAAPDLKMLHLDNINPGLIATFPEESREVLRIICENNTAGDTAAMGLESLDPEVIRLNDLKCSPEEAIRAIEIVNEYGARREGGIPKLLPGLNLIHGLTGESENTFEKNYLFLKDLMARGLLLRRINIRQAVTFANTKLDTMQKDPDSEATVPSKKRRPHVLEERFKYYRDKIRHEVDHPMLLLNFPPGTLMREVILENTNQGFFLGRPLGSYPVTVKIPIDDKRAAAAFATHDAVDVIIAGAEERSLVGLVHPIRIEELGLPSLNRIPGLGRRRASDLLLSRPSRYADLAKFFDGRPFAREEDYEFLSGARK